MFQVSLRAFENQLIIIVDENVVHTMWLWCAKETLKYLEVVGDVRIENIRITRQDLFAGIPEAEEVTEPPLVVEEVTQELAGEPGWVRRLELLNRELIRTQDLLTNITQEHRDFKTRFDNHMENNHNVFEHVETSEHLFELHNPVFTIRDRILISGTPHENFEVILLRDFDNNPRSTLKMKIDFDTSLVTRSYQENDGTEYNYETYGGFPFTRDNGFSILISCDFRNFYIKVNGQDFASYGYRSDLESLKIVKVVGALSQFEITRNQ